MQLIKVIGSHFLSYSHIPEKTLFMNMNAWRKGGKINLQLIWG